VNFKKTFAGHYNNNVFSLLISHLLERDQLYKEVNSPVSLQVIAKQRRQGTHWFGWLGGIVVRTLDLQLSVSGSVSSHDTVRLFLS